MICANIPRNIKRFPEDFMFQLSKTEFHIWKSQIVTSNSDKMNWTALRQKEDGTTYTATFEMKKVE